MFIKIKKIDKTYQEARFSIQNHVSFIQYMQWNICILVPLRFTPFTSQQCYGQMCEINGTLVTHLHGIKGVICRLMYTQFTMCVVFIASVSNPYFIKQRRIRLAVVFFYRLTVLSINIVSATLLLKERDIEIGALNHQMWIFLFSYGD